MVRMRKVSVHFGTVLNLVLWENDVFSFRNVALIKNAALLCLLLIQP
jgi:hypothetical protein